MDKARKRLYEQAATTDGVFRLQDARDAELTRGRIDYCVAGEWTSLYGGVFLAPGAPLTWDAQVRAAAYAGAPHAAISHRTAAARYDVPGGRKEGVEITTPRWLRTQRPELIVHELLRLDERDIRELDGIRIVTPELLLLQLAAVYRSPDFVERIIHAMRRKRLITLESAIATFSRYAKRGRPGVRVLRAALSRWDPSLRPTDSDMEALVAQILRDHGFAHAIPQFEIRDETGHLIARPDFSLVQPKVAVEYESNQEHTDEISLARDSARRNRLTAAGWRIVEARHADVKKGGPDLIKTLRALIAASLSQTQSGISTQVRN